MQAKPMADIVKLTNNLIEDNDAFIPYWSGVMDAYLTYDPFFLDGAENVLRQGLFNTDVDIIIGTNTDEGILGIFPALLGSWEDFSQTNWTARLFNFANKSDIFPIDVDKANKVLEFYVGSTDNINEEHIQDVIDMLTDSDFLYGTYKTINYFLKQNMTVYEYVFQRCQSHIQ